MKEININKVMRITGVITLLGILTGLLGEYVISREVNGYIQLAAVGAWLYITMRLGKIVYKLILNK